MNPYRFEQAARSRRNKALAITILFHLALFAALGAPKGEFISLLPSAVQHWLGMEQTQEPEAPQSQEELARP